MALKRDKNLAPKFGGAKASKSPQKLPPVKPRPSVAIVRKSIKGTKP